MATRAAANSFFFFFFLVRKILKFFKKKNSKIKKGPHRAHIIPSERSTGNNLFFKSGLNSSNLA